LTEPAAASAPEQRIATNRLFAGYLLVAAPALLFPAHPRLWPVLLAAHLLAAAALLGVGPFRELGARLRSRAPRTYDFISDWYLLLLIPALYTELATLNLSIWQGRYFDDLILRAEALIFNGQPSRELSVDHPSVLLSELLHGAYLSYYFIIYAPFVILYARGRRQQHRAATFAVMLAFFSHYIFFIYFPVQGPRYLFPAPGGELADGPVYQFTHRLLEAGSSRGAAFPSSHVGVSIAQTVTMFRFLPGLAPAMAVATVGLTIGAVYGGFHYAIDVAIGFLLGFAIALAAPRIRAWWSGRQADL
jgi:membrane-associated phospholipid phosphatase